MKKKNFDAKLDPYLKRETAKYDRPVASREHILTTLTDAAGPLVLEDLLELFNIHDAEGKEGVRRRLLAMARDGQIVGTSQGAYRPFIAGKDKQPVPRYFKEQFVERVTQEQAVTEAVEHYELPNEWPEKVLKECKAWGSSIPDAELKRRQDIRHLPLVTIDGEDARDFDDAVYAETMDHGGFKLLVAIADVSFYVRHGGATDHEAIKRGNSVYFPRHVIPMLPETLSNELCSLKPNVDRLCMVCEMEVDASGNLSHYKFYEAVMRSKARLTYAQVAAVINAPEKMAEPEYQKFADVWSHIFSFYELYKLLYSAREERGALDFDTVEGALILDESGELTEIKAIVRNEAHRMIEEAMLLANVATADFFEKKKIPGIYRIHEGVRTEKFDDLRDFLKVRGVVIGNNPTTKDLQQLLVSLHDRPDYPVIQTVVLRSLNQAVYSPHNIGHFGLAYAAYTHFTSPIRRYPDLVVHRLIRGLIHPNDKNSVRYTEKELEDISIKASQTERQADEASRRVATTLKCALVKRHLGETFKGIVSGVTSFGLFLTLNDLLIDGLIHIATLTPQDYYTFDATHHRLVGERAGGIFELGQELTVKVVKVNVWDRKVDFLLAGSEK